MGRTRKSGDTTNFRQQRVATAIQRFITRYTQTRRRNFNRKVDYQPHHLRWQLHNLTDGRKLGIAKMLIPGSVYHTFGQVRGGDGGGDARDNGAKSNWNPILSR